MQSDLSCFWLGQRPYAEVHALQRELVELRKEERIGDTLLLLEHDPVITLGRGTRLDHLLATEGSLAGHGVALEEVGRGGDVTLHAPGQLVAYPILSLAPDRCDVRRYVRDLTRVMQTLVAPLGIEAGAWNKYIGLWVDAAAPGRFTTAEEAKSPKKIGAIGVRISRWVTMHGFALNLAVDLDLYRFIVPCGIADHGVTSVKDLLGTAPTPAVAAARCLASFREVFGWRQARFTDRSGTPLLNLPREILADRPRL